MGDTSFFIRYDIYHFFSISIFSQLEQPQQQKTIFISSMPKSCRLLIKLSTIENELLFVIFMMSPLSKMKNISQAQSTVNVLRGIETIDISCQYRNTFLQNPGIDSIEYLVLISAHPYLRPDSTGAFSRRNISHVSFEL